MPFVILPDVCCDLNSDICREFGLTDYMRGHVIIDGTRDIPTTLDWENIGMQEFYKLLTDKKHSVTTAPSNAEEYYAFFEKYVKQGYDIINFNLSSKISAMLGFSQQARERILNEYPNAKIYCFDTFRMSGAYGILVLYALDMQKQGKSYDEIIEWLEANKRRVHQMGPIDDLMFIARRGRITMGKAIMGSFAGVKPMGDCNAEGYTTILGKAKGIKKALDATVKYVKATIVDPEDQYILICHTNRAELAEIVRRQIEQEIPAKKVFVSDVYMGCAPNIGPGMVGVYYLGKEITGDLAEEKEILNKILGK